MNSLPKYLQWFFTFAEWFVGLFILIALCMVGFGSKALLSSDGEGDRVQVSLDVGTVEFELPPESYRIESSDVKAERILIEDAAGKISIQDPEDLGGFLDVFVAPMVVFILFGGGMFVAILECLRRFFRSVRRGESFQPATVANLHKIGVLIIVLEVGIAFLSLFIHSEISRYLIQTMSVEGIETQFTIAREGQLSVGFGAEEAKFGINVPIVLLGLMVLAIGEAFRQGVALKEESELTI